ncbi:Gfo/Idh/MocA family protein [Paenibacillus naphthalenovorans]|uniref:Oxidoreductase n=1 Tax=Paenibacillus naphthalenovorans TaxID=162209 RepID=A0A0U2U1I1_9BACL|nr:Gfo/Idh/MocA family oxidoreductase [Paenibacillus naphthalenovorans]ALS20473.1 oxidoreductase [Paenibacillus naphthalenovorans]GCL73043.1 gfo/Idh/MocA family oxidoreductase [Paenibacillus naphthalenovorans]
MIRFAVIGTNWITEELIKAAREIEDFALTAVYSRTEEKAKEFAAKHDIPHLFTDLGKMAQSDVFDAVYIASPNSFHAQQAILCMSHGKHVLCEKPIASNTQELRNMIAAAKENHVLLMEALKSTLLPNFQAIREHLHKIGPVRRYFAGYCQYSSRYDAYKQGTVLNAFNPVFSNGSLMDLGVYCIYPMAVLFGKPEQIKASGILLGSGVDGEGSILMKYKEMEAVIMHSKISSSYLPSEIQGEYGTMIIDKINQPEKVEIRYRDGKVEELTRPQRSQSMYYEVKEFIDLLKAGRTESATNSHAHSMTTLEIMDEARQQIGLQFPADQEK